MLTKDELLKLVSYDPDSGRMFVRVMSYATTGAHNLNDVERHGLVIGDDIEPIPNGDYVLYTDYAALQQQLAAALEALQAETRSACNCSPSKCLHEKTCATLHRDRQP